MLGPFGLPTPDQILALLATAPKHGGAKNAMFSHQTVSRPGESIHDGQHLDSSTIRQCAADEISPA